MAIMNRILCAAFFLWIVAVPASASQNDIRPGLWEVTTTSDLLNLVPHIPPDTMQQINDLARQYGLVMPNIQNKSAISHVCITPAMAAQEIPTYFYDGQSGCSIKNARRSGNRFQIELFCANAQFQRNGTAEGVFTSPEDFSGHTEFDSVVMGNPVYATAETRGRWVGEKCAVTQPATRPSTLPRIFPAQ